MRSFDMATEVGLAFRAMVGADLAVGRWKGFVWGVSGLGGPVCDSGAGSPSPSRYRTASAVADARSA